MDREIRSRVEKYIYSLFMSVCRFSLWKKGKGEFFIFFQTTTKKKSQFLSTRKDLKTIYLFHGQFFCFWIVFNYLYLCYTLQIFLFGCSIWLCHLPFCVKTWWLMSFFYPLSLLFKIKICNFLAQVSIDQLDRWAISALITDQNDKPFVHKCCCFRFLMIIFNDKKQAACLLPLW